MSPICKSDRLAGPFSIKAATSTPLLGPNPSLSFLWTLRNFTPMPPLASCSSAAFICCMSQSLAQSLGLRLATAASAGNTS
eukprot:CAMPEP_0174735878 /NCGR_PEP_ID=MMETSP1094-20130205/65700_1 /TAXON_ID=156173 /ORGANISM="Chrysochromulina brevifilum, Strain UTEX LB 985" /LENGTH=80 /DNA_ID=CAMNT_0015938893 /DNA_START=495 /DNA_END=737 /DNA_ORIENTATION=-